MQANCYWSDETALFSVLPPFVFRVKKSLAVWWEVILYHAVVMLCRTRLKNFLADVCSCDEMFCTKDSSE